MFTENCVCSDTRALMSLGFDVRGEGLTVVSYLIHMYKVFDVTGLYAGSVVEGFTGLAENNYLFCPVVNCILYC